MGRDFCQEVCIPPAAFQPRVVGLPVNHSCGMDNLEQVTWLWLEVPQWEGRQDGASCGTTTWQAVRHPAPLLCLELYQTGTWRWVLSTLSEQ